MISDESIKDIIFISWGRGQIKQEYYASPELVYDIREIIERRLLTDANMIKIIKLFCLVDEEKRTLVADIRSHGSLDDAIRMLKEVIKE